MSLFVLDSSVALAWVLPDEGNTATSGLRAQALHRGVSVPGLWLTETGNVLLKAERRGRITLSERKNALSALAEFPIRVDPVTIAHVWGEVLSIASANGLTAHDASYLELALRLRLPLASLDRQLGRAARDCGVAVLGE